MTSTSQPFGHNDHKFRPARVIGATIVSLAVAIAASGVAPAQAGLVGNVLTARTSDGDTADTVLFSNFVPMPIDGTVDSVSIFNQGKAGSFRMLQLRPQNAQTEFTIVYDSGALTPTVGLPGDTVERLPFSSPATVQAGDWFAHYGNGIAYSTPPSPSAANPQDIFYSISAATLNNAIAGGTPIKVDGSTPGFPRPAYNRDYAWAVDLLEYITPDVTDITPIYVAGTNYNRILYQSVGNAIENDGRYNFDVATNQQYMWFDYSDALANIPCGRLLSAELSWTGSVYADYVGTPLVESEVGVFAV
ncbi:hypothetical protein KKC91_12640, partial [bacterium]|nr:hypothetical protein [bacterium]